MYINNINELDKIIRTTLINQSQITGNFVRAASSLYGADLDKKDGNVFESISDADVLILFENTIEPTNSNMSETRGNKIYYDLYYNTHVTLYGNPSLTLVNKLIARLRTENVREYLSSQGVYLKSVSDATKLQEFINGVVWMRNDFDISLACSMEILQVTNADDFSEYSKKEIITF